jgi:transcriptional regulator with XRE-family HTH domain
MPGKKRERPTVTETLKAEIQGSGRNLSQLARDSGVSAGQLSRFVRGERMLTGEAIDKLCSTLGLRLARERKPRPAPKEGE